MNKLGFIAGYVDVVDVVTGLSTMTLEIHAQQDSTLHPVCDVPIVVLEQ